MFIQSYQRLSLLLLSFLLLLSSACSSIISSTASNMAANLSYTILNSDDPQTVADAAPAYLLLMDSFLVDSKQNAPLLQSTASLYSAYSSIFVADTQRSIKMSNKALSYAQYALCLENKKLCHLRDINFTDFSLLVDKINKKTMDSWYVLGSSWAGWIKANSGSMSAIAELPRVNLIMSHILGVDENYQAGQVHLYLGVLNTLLPPALGGKPKLARQHFEQAIEISQHKNLMAKVLFAEKYARLMFDQVLHDQLLNEVLQADPYSENLTLMNILAQDQAQKLLTSSAEYF